VDGEQRAARSEHLLEAPLRGEYLFPRQVVQNLRGHHQVERALRRLLGERTPIYPNVGEAH
jgi:hypothetical protein